MNQQSNCRTMSSQIRISSVFVLVALLFIFGMSGLGGLIAPANASGAAFDPTLSVYFLDVDQGDATLFVAKDFTLLIDAGRHDRSEVVPLLRQIGVQSIDLFILTHPHADHIGQCAAVLGAFPVREVWMSGDAHTTLTFERCVDAIIASGAGYYEPRAGEAFALGSARIEVVHPDRVTGDFNNGSVSVRIVYGDVAFLLTGDAEREAEQSMLERGHNLRAHVAKLGHHGSRTSSTESFLRRVQPDIAIYSAGRGNSYGHPHPETLRTIEQLGATLFGTDVNGTIRVVTDGSRVQVVTERGGPVISGRTAPTFVAGGDAVGGAGTKVGGTGSGAAVPSPSMSCAVGQVDINNASPKELTRIIHVGPAIAERIVAARPFNALDDLLRVSGIGNQRLQDMKAQGLACVGP